jgi:hypothetical protein
MSALYDSQRPLPKGTLVRYKDLKNKEQNGRVKDAGLYMLWVEDLENKDVSVFIRYDDLTAVLEQ